MKECPSCFHENPDDTKACQECGYEFETGFGSEGTRMAPVEITAFSKGDLIAARYRVERELGRGGMGVVYLVSDTELRDERVAVKMVPPPSAGQHGGLGTVCGRGPHFPEAQPSLHRSGARP